MNGTRRGLRKWAGWAIVIVAGLALAWWMTRPQAVPVDLGEVVRAPLRVTVDQEGRTRVRHRYLVSAPVGGQLERVALEPGDTVTARDTVVARLRPDDAPLLDARARATAEARVRTAEALVTQAEATLSQARLASEFANRERDRMVELFDQQVVSARDRDAADAEAAARARQVDVADAALEAARREQTVAQAALESPRADASGVVVVRAPVSGVVLRRLRESAAVVAPGEPIVEVGDLSTLEVVADYLSADAVRITPGMKALIDRWGGQGPLSATVRLIEPSGFVKISALGVEEQRVNVVLDFDASREVWSALGDGYRVEVRVIEFEAEVLTAPTSALFRDGDGWAVFAVGGDGVVRHRPVEVGRRTGQLAEVMSGLAAGDRVVLHPSDRVAAGVLVERR